jgi:hypothetical protein
VKCTRIDLGPGVTGWVCRGRQPRPAGCSVPHCGRPHTVLCDFPMKAKTCDAKLCDAHRTKVGPNLDHCPAHARMGQLTLGIEKA